jgi:hypothetical protein
MRLIMKILSLEYLKEVPMTKSQLSLLSLEELLQKAETKSNLFTTMIASITELSLNLASLFQFVHIFS